MDNIQVTVKDNQEVVSLYLSTPENVKSFNGRDGVVTSQSGDYSGFDNNFTTEQTFTDMNVTGSTDFPTQVKTDDGPSVATTAFVQSLIQDMSAGLKFKGTWNADTNTPSLTSSLGEDGNFYIVDVSGSTDLNGTTDWQVGDWAVFVDADGASSWRKVDNSSVLDGQGTASYIPKWSGLGTSMTLGDSIIYENSDGISLGTENSLRFSQLRSDVTKTELGTVANTYINTYSDVASDATGTAYGIVSRSLGQGSFKDEGLVGLYGIGRSEGTGGAFYSYGAIFSGEQTGSGDVDYLIGVSSRAESKGNGVATNEYVRGISAEARVDNADATVNNLQGSHVTANLVDGTVGEVKVQLLDFDYSAGTITGDFSYLRIQEDNVPTVGGTARAIHSLSELPSTFAGSIGIGTDSPSYKLDVDGSSRLKDSASQLILDNSSRSEMSYGANNYFRANGGSASIEGPSVSILTDGTEAMRITSSGNVGIGTTSPDEKLEVVGNIQISSTATSTDSGVLIRRSDNATGIDIWNDGSNGLSYIDSRYASSSGDLHFRVQTNGTPKTVMTVTGDEKIGIGTTSPETILHVNSSDTVSYIHLTNSSTGDTGNDGVDFGVNGSDVYLWNREDSSTIFGTNSTERMRIRNDGNVGIGTYRPNAKLQVGGDMHLWDREGGTDGAMYFSQGTTNTTTAKINTNGISYFNGGNVGIGTTTPAEELTVVGDANFTGSIAVGSVNAHSSFTFYNQGTSYFNNAVTVDAAFTQSGGDASTFSGDVKLGDNNKLLLGDSNGLQIYHDGSSGRIEQNGTGKLILDTISTGVNIQSGNGETRFTKSGANSEIKVDDASQVNKVVLKASGNSYFNGGNVGIGTDSPISKLHIDETGTSLPALYMETARYGISVIGDGTSNSQYLLSLKGNGGSTDAMFVQSSGNVGIGTANPTEKLQINAGDILINNSTLSTIKSGGSLYLDLNTFGTYAGRNFRISDNGTSLVNVKQTGEVGIGTTSPDAILHLKDSTDNAEVKIDTNDNALGDNALIKFNGARAQVGWIDAAVTLTDGGGNKDIKLKVNTGSIFLQTNNTNRLIVAEGGNVGIGTTSPSEKLEVDGNVKADAMVLTSPDGTVYEITVANDGTLTSTAV